MSNANSYLSKNRIARGEIFYILPFGHDVNEDEFVGGRPAVVVSNDMNNEFNGIVEVVYMTREGHCRTNQPTNVPIMATGIKSVALCHQVCTVSKKRIGKYVGECSIAEMKAIERAICVGLCTDSIFTDKNIRDVLEIWKNGIRKNPDTKCIEDEEPEDFETPDVVETKEFDDISESKVEEKDEPIVDVEKHPDYIKVVAERDIFKDMYNDLLKKCMKAGIDV